MVYFWPASESFGCSICLCRYTPEEDRYTAWNTFDDSPMLDGVIYGKLSECIYGGILDSTPATCKLREIPYNVVRFERSIDVIQRAWRKSLYDPMYRVCRRRLMGEFEELMRDPP